MVETCIRGFVRCSRCLLLYRIEVFHVINGMNGIILNRILGRYCRKINQNIVTYYYGLISTHNPLEINSIQ